MRLDHLLSKEIGQVGCASSRINPTKTEEEVRGLNTVECFMCKCPRKLRFLGRVFDAYTSRNAETLWKASFPKHFIICDVHLLQIHEISGADALRGNTRSHPEHDG